MARHTSRNRFPLKDCVLCQIRPSEGVGEHVWPKWFIKEFQGEGPFKTEKASVAYTTRDGTTPATSSGLPGAHVPMCKPCNGRLDRTIEKPAKGVVRRPMPKSAGHDWPSMNSAEAVALARWFLKIGVLMRHPEAVHDQPHVNRDPDVPRYTVVPREWLDWMLFEQDPPNGFSVYAARRSLMSEAPWAGDQARILLPRRIHIGERRLEYASMSFGIRGLDVAIVWHPGWAIIHPQVENRRAAVVWPNSSGIDFGRLPEVHPAESGFVIDGTVLVFPNEERFREATQTPLQAGIAPVGHMLGGDGRPQQASPSGQ